MRAESGFGSMLWGTFSPEILGMNIELNQAFVQERKSFTPEFTRLPCGKDGSRLHGFPCFPYSVISMACCSPGRGWIQSYIKRRNAPYSPEMFVVIGFR